MGRVRSRLCPCIVCGLLSLWNGPNGHGAAMTQHAQFGSWPLSITDTPWFSSSSPLCFSREGGWQTSRIGLL